MWRGSHLPQFTLYAFFDAGAGVLPHAYLISTARQTCSDWQGMLRKHGLLMCNKLCTTTGLSQNVSWQMYDDAILQDMPLQALGSIVCLTSLPFRLASASLLIPSTG